MIKELFGRLKAAYHCLVGNSVIINAGIEVKDGKARIYVLRHNYKDGDAPDGYMFARSFHRVNKTRQTNGDGTGLLVADYIEFEEVK